MGRICRRSSRTERSEGAEGIRTLSLLHGKGSTQRPFEGAQATRLRSALGNFDSRLEGLETLRMNDEDCVPLHVLVLAGLGEESGRGFAWKYGLAALRAERCRRCLHLA